MAELFETFGVKKDVPASTGSKSKLKPAAEHLVLGVFRDLGVNSKLRMSNDPLLGSLTLDLGIFTV